MPEKPIDSLNMIPFIDIMLVLLTIVLMTSSFIATGRIPVNLPEASVSAPDSNEVELIEINADGVIYYSSGVVNLEELKTSLAGLEKTTAFLLRADKNVRLQSFVDVADVLKHLGFSKVAVETEVGAR